MPKDKGRRETKKPKQAKGSANAGSNLLYRATQ